MEEIKCPFKKGDVKEIVFNFLIAMPRRKGISVQLHPILVESGFTEYGLKSIPPLVSGTISAMKLYGLQMWYVMKESDTVSVDYGTYFLILTDEEANRRREQSGWRRSTT